MRMIFTLFSLSFEISDHEDLHLLVSKARKGRVGQLSSLLNIRDTDSHEHRQSVGEKDGRGRKRSSESKLIAFNR